MTWDDRPRGDAEAEQAEEADGADALADTENTMSGVRPRKGKGVEGLGYDGDDRDEVVEIEIDADDRPRPEDRLLH
jgi:hypothetical protein